MTEWLDSTVSRVVRCLVTAGRERHRPERVNAELAAVLGDGAAFELVREIEADGTPSYDVVLPLARDVTVSIGAAAGPATPWALRGAQRWTDAYLVRVDGLELKVGEAMGLLDFVWGDRRLIEKLVDQCIIKREIMRRRITVTDEEVQVAQDRLRWSNRLLTIEATEAWLERHGMTHATLEKWSEDIALSTRLRALIGTEAGALLGDAPAKVTRMKVARLAFADEVEARTAARAIGAGGHFYEQVERHWNAEGAASPTSWSNLFEVWWSHREPASSAAVFAAAPGTSVGPIQVAGLWSIVRVVSQEVLESAGPDAAAQEAVAFEAWLARRRREARVEWFWGEPTEGVARSLR
jgi:putative peptide maturation system protein